MWMNQFLWPPGRDAAIEDIGCRSEFTGTTTSVKGGCFVDTFRHLYPDKKESYTNWCTLTSARDTNYGNRIDYILADVDLVKTDLSDCIIMMDVEGSDHCPVRTEFLCTCVPAPKCPFLCTKNMPEFAGKQQKLSNFFVKKVSQPELDSKLSSKPEISERTNNISSNESSNNTCNINVSSEKRKLDVSQSPVNKRQKINSNHSNIKKQSSTSGKQQQQKLLNFFTNNKDKSSVANPSKESNRVSAQNAKTSMTKEPFKVVSSDTSDSPTSSQESLSDKPKVSTVSAWKNLLKGPPTAPLCKGHKEPCLLRTVKKEGPNKGKQFFVCNRAEGLSTNPQARCDFFQWIEKTK